MNIKIILFSSLLSSAPLMTWAETTINVTGQVIASPCVVDTGTVSKVVNLGEETKQNLINAGDGAVWSDFDLLVQTVLLAPAA
ncbi:TPA: type 1 fimbrial protein [Enterobacter bugandensis]|uniref:fimbrial protein n=1 Tax=Enterobacter bugandensis TaxID=881260 RepID=UPI002073AB40|nr:hypothetical protein [Enterobacter bugandensis]HAS1308817.1 type 1 fimbrial protein [Enterobacter bugandensis]HCD1870513.1 type 1 fimbrial protein [Enterobacter bugandensis]HCD2450658.1 type 1 fimbrial protein [Enterobacter bugandensis]HCD5431313.1 type 1 fimbrial protein [Enterobacter bugandensis]HCD7215988.1 type 1 fimbrial protein [Enterobacter bugandensis]